MVQAALMYPDKRQVMPLCPEGVVDGGAAVVLAASVFHFLTLSIKQVKEYLKGRGIEVRM
jgi:imidazole glycerol phosphate synthase subunit HisF